MDKIQELNNDVREITNARKLAELKAIQQFVVPELLDDNRHFKSLLESVDYNLILGRSYTEPRYDESLVDKNDIINYFKPMGIIIKSKQNPYRLMAKFDPQMFQSYEPQTKTVTYKTWFGLSSKSVQVGLTPKDRLKMAILDLYPSYSQDTLDDIFRQKAHPYKFSDGSYLHVSPKDPWYFSMLNYPKEYGYFQIKFEPDTANFTIQIE